MCDPATAAYAFMAAATVASAEEQRKETSQARTEVKEMRHAEEAERSRLEAEATASAQQRIAQAQRRRREQGSLIARGRAEPSLGEDPSATGLIKTPQTLESRSTVAKRSSLLSRGATGYEL